MPAPYLTMDRRNTIQLALVFFLGAGVYLNSLGNGFTFDDFPLVVENPVVLSGSPGRAFSSPYWPEHPEYGLYRPLTTLTYCVQYLIHGMDATGFHLGNVLLHLLNGSLVYWIARALIGHSWSACVAALVFLVHPIQTEAVNGVVGRAELLAAFWVLTAWVLYIGASRAVSTLQQRLYGLSLVALFLGCMSKENAVVFIGFVASYDLYNLLRFKQTGPARKILTEHATRYVPLLLVVLLFLGIRHGVTGAILLPTRPDFVDNPLAHLPPMDRAMMAVAVWGKCFGLLTVPWSLSADYSFNAIPQLAGFFDPRFWWGLLVLSAAGLVVTFAALRRVDALWGLSVSLVLLAYLPVSNLLFPIGTVLGERLLYLPSLGICLAAGHGFGVLSRRTGTLPYAAAGAAVLLGFYAGRTLLRNPEWRDNMTLFESAARVAPNSAKAHFSVGNSRRDRGDLRGALRSYERALVIYPEYAEVHYNLGLVFRSQGFTNRALEAYSRALRADSTHAGALNNAGVLLSQAGQHREAGEVFRRLHRMKPGSPDVLYNAGLALHQAGESEQAAVYYQKVLDGVPDHEDAALNLGALYQEAGYSAESIAVYKRLLQVRPTAYRAAFNLGAILEKMERLEPAIGFYRQAAEADDERGAVALFRVGVLLAKTGERDAARSAFGSFMDRWRGEADLRRKAEKWLTDLKD